MIANPVRGQAIFPDCKTLEPKDKNSGSKKVVSKRERAVLWIDRIELLIQRDGRHCHYCKRPVRLARELSAHRKDDATIDHKIPTSKGGANAPDNLLLACRECNEAKADRDYNDFVARPYRVERDGRPIRSKWPCSRWPRNPPVREEKPIKGTLAHAIAKGEVDEVGRYRMAPMDHKPSKARQYREDQNELDRIERDWPWLGNLVRPRVEQVGFGPWAAPAPAKRMTALETARYLRESAETKGKPWPLA